MFTQLQCTRFTNCVSNTFLKRMFPYLSNHVLKLLSTMCAKHYYQTCVTHVLEKYVLHILNFSKTCVAKTCVLKTCVLKTCVTHKNVKTCVLKTCIFGDWIEKGRIENVWIENMCNTCFVKRACAAHVFKRVLHMPLLLWWYLNEESTT